MSEIIQVVAEPTPNPNALRFSWGRPVLEEGGPYDFASPAAAEKGSPLAARLFRINGVTGVFIAKGFVAVTKHPGVGWDGIEAAASQAISDHIRSGEDIITVEEGQATPVASDPQDIERRVKEILDRDIRPAVAMDGGDIVFVGYNAGVVMLQLKGACHGCPSSMATLKMGVENRLRREIEEITEVVAVM